MKKYVNYISQLVGEAMQLGHKITNEQLVIYFQQQLFYNLIFLTLLDIHSLSDFKTFSMALISKQEECKSMANQTFAQ